MVVAVGDAAGEAPVEFDQAVDRLRFTVVALWVSKWVKNAFSHRLGFS